MNQPLPKTNPHAAYEIITWQGAFNKPYELKMDGATVGYFADQAEAYAAMVKVRTILQSVQENN